MEISQRVQELLSHSKLTQKELSAYISVAPSTLNNWIKLGRSIPAEYIISICEFLNVSSEYLLTGKETEIKFTEEENQLISDFRSLSPQGQEYVNQQMFMAKEVYKKQDILNRK